jgi:hypothetical protein
MENLGGKKTIFPAYTGMKHPQDQVGIFMTPTLERTVKTVHDLKVRAPQAHITTSYAMPTKIGFDPHTHIRHPHTWRDFTGITCAPLLQPILPRPSYDINRTTQHTLRKVGG